MHARANAQHKAARCDAPWASGVQGLTPVRGPARERPHAIGLFGHRCALSGPHTQLGTDALRRGAQRAAQHDALGTALPLALAGAVQPSLRRAFDRIDVCTGRRPPRHALAPPGVPETRLPVVRYPDYLLSQSASFVGLTLKLALLAGGCAYHVVTAVAVGLIWGLEAGRVRGSADTIRRTLALDGVPASATLGGTCLRYAVNAVLGPPPQKPHGPIPDVWLAHFVLPLEAAYPEACRATATFMGYPLGWRAMWQEVTSQTLTLTLTPSWDAAWQLVSHRQARARLKSQLQAYARLGLTTLGARLAACPVPERLCSPWQRTLFSIDWRRAPAPQPYAASTLPWAQALARVNLEPLRIWLQAPARIQDVHKALADVDIGAVHALLRAQKLDCFIPFVTAAKLKIEAYKLDDETWHGALSFIESLWLSDVIDDLAWRMQDADLRAALFDVAAARRTHAGQAPT